MPPLSSLALAVLALGPPAVRACETSNPHLGDLGIQACAVRTLDGPEGPEVVLCSCPFTSCAIDDDNILDGRCEMTSEGVLIVLSIAFLGAALLVMCLWMACCKGAGCTFTAPFRGGWLCGGRYRGQHMQQQQQQQKQPAEVTLGPGGGAAHAHNHAHGPSPPHHTHSPQHQYGLTPFGSGLVGPESAMKQPAPPPPGTFQSPLQFDTPPPQRPHARVVVIDENQNEVRPYMP